MGIERIRALRDLLLGGKHYRRGEVLVVGEDIDEASAGALLRLKGFAQVCKLVQTDAPARSAAPADTSETVTTTAKKPPRAKTPRKGTESEK